MNQTSETEHYANNLDLFLELLRHVIGFLESEDDHKGTSDKEAQLREISNAIEKLEKLGVAIPDALRAEKIRLAGALSMQSASVQSLSYLADEMDDILDDLKARLGRKNQISLGLKTKRIRSNSPRTDNEIFRKLIIDALRQMGGSAHMRDVIKYIGEHLEGKLLPGDMHWRESTKEYAWQNNAQWTRYEMTQDGILKTDSPRGYWELTEDYK